MPAQARLRAARKLLRISGCTPGGGPNPKGPDMPSTDVAELIAEERRTMTATARAAYREQLERQVNPDGTLPPDEVRKRAQALRSEIMRSIARKSADARSEKAAKRKKTAAEQAIDDLIATVAAAVRQAA